MTKRILLPLLALLHLVGCAFAALAADTNTVATIGDKAYESLQAAVNAYDGTCIRLEADTDEAVSIAKDIYLDLNGFDVTGNVTITDGTLYVMDSQTDDFTVEDDAGYGSISNVTGNIAAASDYLMVEEAGSYSFHRVDLKIHTMTLRPEQAGVYYKSNFAGDEIVAANVSRYGVALSIKAIPTAENIKTSCATSYFTDFSAGSNGEGTSTLLKNVMKTTNTQAVNDAQSKMPIYGRAYILTNDGNYIFGEAVSRSLQQQAEQIAADAVWNGLTDAQVDASVLMYRKYTQIMRNWNVTNIESALVFREGKALNDGKTLKVLALTSSFGLNTTQLLYDVAVAEGYAPENVIIGRLYASGCTLEKHLNHAPDQGLYQYSKVTGDPTKTDNPGVMQTLITEGNATLLDGLLDEEWDIIFMQQGAAQAPQLNTYKDYISQFRAIVDQYKPNKEARFVWNMLWGYQSDSTISPFPTIFKGDQMYMYQCNIDAVMQHVIPRTDYNRIIPTGTVIQNARSSEFGDHLCRDTYHLNNYGGIMAAYGLFAVLTGQEITEINIDAVTASKTNGIGGAAKITTPLTETQKAIIMESVNNALKDPFHVTPSKYPYIDCESYTYTENLSFFGNTNEAVCPECDQKVAWIEINQDNVQSLDVSDGKGYFGSLLPEGTYHFYLSSDVSYTATDANKNNALLYVDASRRNVCLHLNGHDLTTTNCSVAYLAGSSKLSIMGNGTVTGNRSSSSKYIASAIMLNSGTNGTNLGTIKLCSGTYVQPAGNTQLAPISTSWQAGLMQILEDVTISGNAENYSICLNAANNKSDLSASYTERLEIYGGTFNRPVYCKAFSASAKNSAIHIYGGTLNDGIEIADSADITISGNPVISGNGLNLPAGMTVSLGELTEGAKIKVKNTGAFTGVLSDAATYVPYFSPVSGENKITVKGGQLYCSSASIYAKNLDFETGTQNAYCAACDSTVTWIELNQDNIQSLDVTSGGYFGSTMPEGTYHFYLSTDVSYTATDANKGNSLLHMAASRRNVCLHLNGHNLTATNCAVAVLAGNAKLNVLGTGTVTGNHTNNDKFRGSAIVLNSGTTASNFGVIRLYSGTFVQPDGNTQLAPVSTAWQGGKLEIFEDATLIGNESNNSLCINSTNGNASNKYAETVNIYGGTFSRPVYCYPSSTVATAATALNISGGTFNDGIRIIGNTNVTLSGAPVIGGAGLQLPAGTTVTLGELTEGADIRVVAEGAFTAANDNAASYLQYFSPAESGYSITADDNVLYCNTCSPYVSNLVFEAGTTNATCPACNTTATWIEVNQDNLSSLLSDGTTGYFGNTIATGTYHFYLSSDVTYTASTANASKAFIYSAGSGRNICLHLNGNDLTCTNAAVVIMASNTKINFMGSGTVSGNHTNSSKFRGSAIIVNSGTSGTSWGGVSLYSGTYVQPADNTQLAPVSTSFQGGHLDIYADATITGNTSNYSVCLNTANNNTGLTASYDEIVNIYGGTFNRPLYAKAFSTSLRNTVLNISGGTFNDGIEIVDNSVDLTLSGSPVIGGAGLKLPAGTTVALDSLTTGASIAVDASGAFTKAHSSAASFLQYFSAALSGYTITAEDNVLYCNQS